MGVNLAPYPRVQACKICGKNIRPLQNDLEGPYLTLYLSLYQGAVKRISGRLVEVSDGLSV